MKCTHQVATKENYSIGKELHENKNIYLLQGSHWYFTNTHISPIKHSKSQTMSHFLLPHPITKYCCYYPGWTWQMQSDFHSHNNETENAMLSFNIYLQAPVFGLCKSSAHTPASACCVEPGTRLHTGAGVPLLMSTPWWWELEPWTQQAALPAPLAPRAAVALLIHPVGRAWQRWADPPEGAQVGKSDCD